MALILAAAAWGFSTAVSLWRLFARPAPSGQVPGFMSAHNLDARGPGEHLLFVVAFTIAAALMARLFFARFPVLRRSSQILIAITLGSSLAIVTVEPSTLVASGIPAVMAAIWIALRDRDWRFGLRDVVLIPSSIVVAIALLRFTSLTPPSAVVIAIFVILLTRMALARVNLKRHNAIAHVVYPTFLVVYTFALLNASPPFLNLYENGHDLVPAAEVSRGEKYYRDVIPMHGLLADGVFDSLAMRMFGEGAGNILRFRFFIAALNAAAIYAVAACATGSPEAGLLAGLLTISALPSRRTWIHVWPRSALPVAAVAMAAGATRRRSLRMLAAASVLSVLAVAQSVDFGIYAVVSVLAASFFWSRPRILTALRSVAIGIAAGILILAALLALNSILTAFVVTTFREVLTLGPSFGFGFFDVGQCCPGMTWLTDVAGEALLVPTTLPFVAWPLVLIWFAVTIARRDATIRWRAAMVVAVWVIVAVMSFAARRQDYAVMLIPALAVILIFYGWRRLPRTAMALAIVLCVIVSHPAWHLFRAMPEIARPPGNPPRVAELPLPRARGVVVDRAVAPAVMLADAYMRQTLAPNETFFDFANAPALYYLTGRRLPIRQIQVSQYEDARLQREVIAALERDRSVRLALIRFPEFAFILDGVPNAQRAPLVARYLETHFAPALDQNGVVFWRRR